MSVEKKRYRRLVVLFLGVAILLSIIYYINDVCRSIPDSVYMYVNQNTKLKMSAGMQVSGTDCVDLESGENEVVLTSATPGSYTVDVSLFGWVPVKSVDVKVVEQREVIPCGMSIGLYLKTEGVLVVGTACLQDVNGASIEPAYGIVKEGDYITSYNGESVNSKYQLSYYVQEGEGEDAILKLNRNGEEVEVKIRPVQVTNDQYQLGIWTRDDSQGIGTLTYLDLNGNFGALGHGIKDEDTKDLLAAEAGLLYRANVWGIQKGEAGIPGGLCGNIIYQEENILGTITANTEYGIFGQANETLQNMFQDTMEIGWKQEVEEGPATILCQVGETVEEYEIQIEKLHLNGSDQNKGMEIRVTDERLLELTNGIIQGMSGSPIIQNGKLVGAVTHVFVNDPQKGYGIFIEHML